MPRLTKSRLAVAALVAFALVLWQSPPNSFGVFCTYDVNAHVSADITIDGERHQASVIHQNSRSRHWISIMNSAGCKQKYGNALAYRLADDTVLVVSAKICRKGANVLSSTGRVDVLNLCSGTQKRPRLAFLVDQATHPKTWRNVTEGVDFSIERMTAEWSWRSPSDDMADVAPELMRSDFKKGPPPWSRTPHQLIPFSRRHIRGQPYDFIVEHSEF